MPTSNTDTSSSALDLRVELAIGNNSIGDPYKLYLTVINEGFCQASDLRVRLESDSYNHRSEVAVPAVHGHGQVDVTVQVTPKAGVGIKDLHSGWKITVVKGKGKEVVASFPFANSVRHFNLGLRSIVSLPPPFAPAFNILVVGWAGSGKSAWFNTIATMLGLTNDINTQVACVGGGGDHCTTTLRRVSLQDQFGLAVNLWDTWGFDDGNYQFNDMEVILDGGAPDGFDMHDLESRELQGQLQKVKKSQDQRRMMAVLFLVTPSQLDSPDQFMEDMKLHMRTFKTRGLNPLLVVAQADMLYERGDTSGVSGNAMLVNDARVVALKRKAADFFQVPFNNVSHAVSYAEQSERDFNVDRLAYTNLQFLLKSAVQFVGPHGPGNQKMKKRIGWTMDQPDSDSDSDDDGFFSTASAVTPAEFSRRPSSARGGQGTPRQCSTPRPSSSSAGAGAGAAASPGRRSACTPNPATYDASADQCAVCLSEPVTRALVHANGTAHKW